MTHCLVCARAGMDLGSLSQMMGTVARKRSEAVKETAELKASFVDPRLLPGRGLVVAGRSSNDEAEADTLEREVAFLQSEDASQRRDQRRLRRRVCRMLGESAK